MRVALCFWGLCRSTDIIIESIQRCIFTVLQNAEIDYDIYLHTYTLYRPYTNTRAEEVNLQLKNTLWKLLVPTKSIVEDQDTVDKILDLKKYRLRGDPWKHEVGNVPFATLDNHVRALWSLHQVTGLWSESGIDYTKVVYLRPDVLFRNPLRLEWLYEPLKRTVLIPDFHIVHGCNDRFAIGEPDAMKVYGSRFTGALAYSKTNLLHSEAYLFHTMTAKGFAFQTVPFRFRRVRAGGFVFEGDKSI